MVVCLCLLDILNISWHLYSWHFYPNTLFLAPPLLAPLFLHLSSWHLSSCRLSACRLSACRLSANRLAAYQAYLPSLSAFFQHDLCLCTLRSWTSISKSKNKKKEEGNKMFVVSPFFVTINFAKPNLKRKFFGQL
jgi:hypothetical protein